jgi:hypothetical protein
VQKSFDCLPQIAQVSGAFFRQADIGTKRFDVDIHFGRLIPQLADGVLELGGLAVSFFETEVRVNLQVQLDE